MPGQLEQLVDQLRRMAWSPKTIGTNAEVRDQLRKLEVQEIVRLTEPAKAEGGAAAVVALYRAWLGLQDGRSPHAFVGWFNLGAELSAVGDVAGAETCFRNAVALKPDFYQAAVNLGLNLEARGLHDDALAVWTSAVQPDEARLALLNHKGRLLEQLGRLDEAEATLFASLLTNPKQPDVMQHWILLRQKTCSWPTFGTGVPGLSSAQIMDSAGPISCLALIDDVMEQSRIVANWLARRPEKSPARYLSPPEGYDHPKLRIGYLSSDFCMHPISYLIAELLERHDRNRFEIYGYCSSPDDGSAIRRRVLAAFDKFTVIGHLPEETAANLIRQDEIDILVDLNGPTKGMRLGVLRAKPAPVQVTYLGFVGPVPVPEIDYMLCDDFTVPRHQAVLYKPQPLHIAGCYQANDSRLPVGAPMSRELAGLPADKFIYCCFSNSFKVTEQIFDAWMTILARTSDTVLWVLEDNRFVRPNMQRRARERGIDPNRLIFAGRVSAEAYLARLKLADLFLDTYPYNAGTTASDALRMGLPLITLSGRTFSSRMAGSLLRAVGLEQLITTDLAWYVEQAVRLAGDRPSYEAIRTHLELGAWQRTLGDAAGFAARLEAVYEEIRKHPARSLGPDRGAADRNSTASVTRIVSAA